MTRFRRCKTLGDMYSDEAIRERIEKEDISFYREQQKEVQPVLCKCKVRRYRRAKMSGLQKRYYAKLYRIGKLKKKPYSQVWKYKEDMQKAIDFLKGMLDYEKSLGKTSMRKLLLKGGDLQVLQFNTEDMKKVEKTAKKYGILYSVLPDCNRKDGLSEVIFHTEAVPRVNMMIQKLKFGKIATFDDYLKNGDEKSLGKLMDFLKKQQGNEKSHTIEGDRVNTAIDGLIEKVGMFAMEKKAISVDQVKENFSINGEQAESVIRQLETIGVLGSKNEDGTHTVMMDKDAFINRVRGYQDLAERMRAVAASKNANLSDVTISKKLIIEENDHAVKTRVPGTWGEEAKYVWLRKENIMEIHGGKTMLTFLDSTKDYKLYDEQNRVVTTQKGTELYTHYDKVESSVRERYEKVQKQQKKTTQKKTVTTKKAR